jgi:hypothetical protein
MLKISELKKPSVGVKISKLNNYSIVCCQNAKGTMVCVYENFPKIKPRIDFNYY